MFVGPIKHEEDSQTARRYFGGTNPVGKIFRVQRGTRLSGPVEIVGVVGDSKTASLRDEIVPTVYTALRQDAEAGVQRNFELRGAGSPESLAAGAKAAMAGIDRGISLEFTPLKAQVDDSLKRERLLAGLSAVFGGLALLLATIGLYGVMSYNVARRRREMGIRMALGAEPRDVLRLVVASGLRMAAAGIAAGLAGALLLTRLLGGLLYGVNATDPAVYAAVAVVLGVVAVAACAVPAQRATRVNPVAALREE